MSQNGKLRQLEFYGRILNVFISGFFVFIKIVWSSNKIYHKELNEELNTKNKFFKNQKNKIRRYLRLEVEVESGFESVQLEFTGRKESGSGRGRGKGGSGAGSGGEDGGNGDGIASGGGSGTGLGNTESGQVTGQETGLVVAGVKGVDEGVDAGAVGAIGNQRLLDGGGGLGVEFGSVLVELEVPVGGVVGVDEGVAVGVNGSVIVFVVGNGDGSSRLGSGGSLGKGSGLLFNLFGTESSGFLTSRGNVRSVQDPESVLSGNVLDSVSLSVLSDVRVLSDSVSVLIGFLPEDVSVLSGECGSSAAVAGVEALFFQNAGIFGVHILGKGAGGQKARQNDLIMQWVIINTIMIYNDFNAYQSKHFDCG